MLFDSITSYKRVMFGWRNIFNIDISRYVFAKFSSSKHVLSIILIATYIVSSRIEKEKERINKRELVKVRDLYLCDIVYLNNAALSSLFFTNRKFSILFSFFIDFYACMISYLEKKNFFARFIHWIFRAPIRIIYIDKTR